MGFLDRFLAMDRRWIFLSVGLCILLPLIWPLGLPATKVTPSVQSIFDMIEEMGPDDVLLLAMDFDPASRPELEPMAVAVLRHAFRRKIRVVGMTLWVTGAGQGAKIMEDAAKEFGAEYGKDYCYLGFKVGSQFVVAQMSVDLFETFKTDYRGAPSDSLSILKGRKTLKDFTYLVSIAAGDPGVDTWVIYGEGIRKLGGGCTAVSVSQYLTYYQSGQINGLMGGLKGASEYEVAIDRKDAATQRMESQSVVHFLIIFLIFVCNLAYFLGRRSI